MNIFQGIQMKKWPPGGQITQFCSPPDSNILTNFCFE